MKLLLFIGFFSLLIYGCKNSTDQHIKDQVLRTALYDNPTNLDPRTYSDAVSFRIIELTYNFLVRMDSTGLPELQLAEKLETPTDTEYIFTLHKNVRFHDGSLLTAYDVAFTFNSVLDPTLNAPIRATLENVKKITVVDSFKIKFDLKSPHAPFLSDLEIGIVAEHVVKSGRDLKKNPLGSGPFIFTRWDQNSIIEFKKNPDYWQGTPKLNKIILLILPEATTRALALENEELDIVIGNFTETSLPQFRQNKRLKVVMGAGSNYVYLGLNQENKYLKEIKVRQAIAHTLDIDMIIKSLLSGVHKRANSMLNKKHWAYNPQLPHYDYNPDFAKKLLDEAGYPDPDGDGPKTRFTLGFKCSSKLLSRQKAQVVQQSLREVGIDVKIQSYEWGTFFEDIRSGRFDMFSLSIVGIYEPAVYDRFFHSHSIGVFKNRIGYRNAEVDKLIELGNTTIEVGKRRQYYQKIQKILQDELPFISLWHETNIAVMDRRLKGFELYPASEWKSFYKMYFEETQPN